MYQEEWEYIKFTTPQVLDKELHMLEGMLQGIAINNKINKNEINGLLDWCSKHELVSHKSPFNEIIPLIKKAAEDGIIDKEEKKDIIWVCNKYTTPNNYYNAITSDMQRMQGMLAGIVADGKIEKEELEPFSDWLTQHESLRTIWPFDEIDSLITEILKDGVIDEQEHHVLVNFCNQFLSDSTGMVLDLPMDNNLLRTGVCSAMPDIVFDDKLFCITGKPKKGRKKDITEVIIKLGGDISLSVIQELDYLIIGGYGSDCWAFACYGRKVETAMNYRKEGLPIQIIHEFDFWDAVEDNCHTATK